MGLDLILKDVEDPWIRENFFRVQNFVQAQALLLADFKFFEVNIPSAQTKYALPHALGFIPCDIIVLSVFGNFNYYFRHQEFDRTNIYITNLGPVKLRFLAGLYREPGYQKPVVDYPIVAPT